MNATDWHSDWVKDYIASGANGRVIVCIYIDRDLLFLLFLGWYWLSYKKTKNK